LIPNLLGFIVSNQIGKPISIPWGNLMADGWWRYFGTMVAIYAMLGTFLMFFILISTSSREDQPPDDVEKTWTWLFLLGLAVWFIIPVYSTGIYPYLPQQIGGGKLLQIEAVIVNDELKTYFTDSTIETYLIDRTSNSTLFLLTTKDKQTSKVFEVASSSIQSIIYKSTH
jgi:hypothetical protein